MKVNFSFAGLKVAFSLFEPRPVDLFTAAERGTLASVPPESLTEEALTNTERGYAPIHVAAMFGDLDQIPEDRLTPAVMLAPSSEKLNALHYAARGRNLHQVPKRLLTPELLGDTTHADWTPMHEIAARGEIGLVPAASLTPELLTRQFTMEGFLKAEPYAVPEPDKMVMGRMLRTPFMSAIEMCIRNGSIAAMPDSVLTREVLEAPTCSGGATAMHVVAETGAWRFIPAKVVSEATGLLQGVNGDTPLHYAAQSGRMLDVPEPLLTTLTMTTPNDAGHTPLHTAAINGNTRFVPPEFLVREHLSLPDKPARFASQGKTVYHYMAAAASLVQVPPSEIDRSDLLRPDANGCTPLHDAAAAGVINCVPMGHVEIKDLTDVVDGCGYSVRTIAEMAGCGISAEVWAAQSVSKRVATTRERAVEQYSLPAEPRLSVSGTPLQIAERTDEKGSL